jgi:hypothetical protein
MSEELLIHPDPLRDFRMESLTFLGRTKDVYVLGEGPAVIVAKVATTDADVDAAAAAADDDDDDADDSNADNTTTATPAPPTLLTP